MLVASLVIGGTAEKLKTRERQSTQTAYRTKILFDANQLIQQASDESEIFRVTANQLKKLLNRTVIVFDDKSQCRCSLQTENDTVIMPQDCEQILLQVTENNVKAGKGTSIFSENDYTFFQYVKTAKTMGQ